MGFIAGQFWKHLDPSSMLTFPKDSLSFHLHLSHFPPNIPPYPTKNTDRPLSLTGDVFKTLTNYWLDKDPYNRIYKKSPKRSKKWIPYTKSPGCWSKMDLSFLEHLGLVCMSLHFLIALIHHLHSCFQRPLHGSQCHRHLNMLTSAPWQDVDRWPNRVDGVQNW